MEWCDSGTELTDMLREEAEEQPEFWEARSVVKAKVWVSREARTIVAVRYCPVLLFLIAY